jgi:hypothetical protein
LDFVCLVDIQWDDFPLSEESSDPRLSSQVAAKEGKELGSDVGDIELDMRVLETVPESRLLQSYHVIWNHGTWLITKL